MSVLSPPPGYAEFDIPRLRDYLWALPAARNRLGGRSADWNIREVGDGNLNLVFLVDGPDGNLCVKQSLPHVRAVRTWRLPVERTFFEHSYFQAIEPIVGPLVPAMYHYEAELFCIVMEQLTPHIILRRGLIAGTTYPHVTRDVAEYVALASFYTSDFAVALETKMDGIALFARNHGLLRITADLVFHDPYRESERNTPTRPQLDDIGAAFRADAELKVAAARLGRRFLACPQALIHGDLHSGSVMVTPNDTRVIDPEFALYGPIGFDLGAFIGNLLISYLSQPGHATTADSRLQTQTWILAQLPLFWDHFRERFLALWEANPAGDVYPADLFVDPSSRAALQAERVRFVDGVYVDMIGFAAVKMIRRILGFAHVGDFLEIADVDRRAACESATLELARTMLKLPENFSTIAALADAARRAGEILRAQFA